MFTLSLGHPEASLVVESSRLTPPGNSIVIEKLYVEGGALHLSEGLWFP